ncbi:cobyrinate a,c-diamide synthase [Anaerolentibacter hominis]|uniref:cobyrinate a,c-diamide synthase n=1 Tax=Anaerolentibacter hominis TaxID=3079009 RepID=UPI0031B86D60
MGKRILLTGTKSGSGKTTITCGLLKLLLRRGLIAESFKCGPDYIDPMFHGAVLGIRSGNLDSYLMDEPALLNQLTAGETKRDIGVIEGVMGFYDGIGMTGRGSTWEISELTRTPVILILDCQGMGAGIGALLKGFLDYRNNRIGGVIFNRLPGKLYAGAADLAKQLGVRPFGYIPPQKDIAFKSRYLGLIPAGEQADIQEKLSRLADRMEETVDIEGILSLAAEAEPLPQPRRERKPSRGKACVAVAKDEAFCFHYRDNLRILEELGCEILWFKPTKDALLPPGSDGLILWGGYPELYARALSENESLRLDILHKIQTGMPVIGECGGFLYLHENLEGADGRTYPMAGYIPGTAFRTNQLQHFGYVEVTAREDTLLLDKGETIRSHEFHYWSDTRPGEHFSVKKAGREEAWREGYGNRRVYAGFPHIHFSSSRTAANRFAKACLTYQREKKK